jgi:two-component system NarL family response regulator
VPEPICVLLADDHPMMREGIAALISRRADMNVVAEANNGREAVELYREHRPDVVLMDLQMPIMDGFEAIQTIRAEFPSARIIVLTTYDGDEDIYRSLYAGAVGYLLKDTSRDELLDAIRTVHHGKQLISPEIAAKLAQRIRRSELTARELEVLNQIAAGKSNHEIGMLLTISEGTVKAHVNNILTKLCVSDRTQAVITAIQRGIVHLD